MKLEINSRRKAEKNHKYVEINNTLLSNQGVKEKIKREIKIILKQMKTKHVLAKPSFTLLPDYYENETRDETMFL